jgi:hypothetical protein
MFDAVLVHGPTMPLLLPAYVSLDTNLATTLRCRMWQKESMVVYCALVLTFAILMLLQV